MPSTTMPQKTEDVHSRKHLAQITDALQCIEALNHIS
jgi:hypothetical protein